LILKNEGTFDPFSEAVKLQERVNKYPLESIGINHMNYQRSSTIRDQINRQDNNYQANQINNQRSVRFNCYNCNSTDHLIQNCPTRQANQRPRSRSVDSRFQYRENNNNNIQNNQLPAIAPTQSPAQLQNSPRKQQHLQQSVIISEPAVPVPTASTSQH
jgi:hypothetical protein